MIIGDVMDQIGDRLDLIDGLRVHSYESDDINVPAALISVPRDIDFSRTYARGMDSITLNVLLLVSDVHDKIRRKEITPYADGDGPKSIKKILETGNYSAFDTIFVANANFDAFKIADVVYLGLRFVVNISGRGSG